MHYHTCSHGVTCTHGVPVKEYNAVTYSTQTPFNSFDSTGSEPSVPLGHDSLMDAETELANPDPYGSMAGTSDPSMAMYHVSHVRLHPAFTS